MVETLTHAATVSCSSDSSLVEQIKSLTRFPAIIDQPLDIDPLDWLKRQPHNVKIVWGDRGGTDLVAAVGAAVHVTSDGLEPAAEVVDRCRDLLSQLPNLRLYGGFAFRPDNNQRGSVWESFGPASFWLPRVTVSDRRLNVVVRNRADVPSALKAVAELIPNGAGSDSRSLPAWTDRADRPDRPRWHECIDSVKQMFHDEVLEKIVLARRVDLDFLGSLDPVQVLGCLEATPACYHFCFQTAPHFGFVGATPERLFFRRGNRIISEVVAGTRPRGTTKSQDERLGEELLASVKDQLEHDIVRKSIRQRLHACVDRLNVDAHAALLKLANKQHLFSRVVGELKPHIDDGHLLERLHPTPAVGGYPTENALNEIQRLEPFERGWYAAPVGWISSDAAEFAVAIRCGLVQNRRVSLYSGAGIVPGSDASAEWEEVEHKISDFLQLMQPSTSTASTLGS